MRAKNASLHRKEMADLVVRLGPKALARLLERR
jgi:hypothetical protein